MQTKTKQRKKSSMQALWDKENSWGLDKKWISFGNLNNKNTLKTATCLWLRTLSKAALSENTKVEKEKGNKMVKKKIWFLEILLQVPRGKILHFLKLGTNFQTIFFYILTVSRCKMCTARTILFSRASDGKRYYAIMNLTILYPLFIMDPECSKNNWNSFLTTSLLPLPVLSSKENWTLY